MLDDMVSPAFQAGVSWGRALQRLTRLEERTDGLEQAVDRLDAEMQQARSWVRRGAILLALWGSFALAGANHDQASNILAAALKLAMR